MLRAGSTIGPYRIVTPLGAGGMGEVYRARDARLSREVAVKVLPEQVSSDPDRLNRFEREARAAAALSHPNILAIYDVGTHDGQPYIVTELLEGQTLRQLIDEGLTIGKAVELAGAIANGLAAAHERGVIHRDLKPGNVLVTTGLVKLLDFGLAKLTEGQPLGGRGGGHGDRGLAHGRRRGARDQRLHGARAAARQVRGPPGGHLRVRLRAL